MAGGSGTGCSGGAVGAGLATGEAGSDGGGIGIAGAGGIGSNVALQLVRGGLGHLKIIDFDHIETSNLNRQFYFSDQIGRALSQKSEPQILEVYLRVIAAFEHAVECA